GTSSGTSSRGTQTTRQTARVADTAQNQSQEITLTGCLTSDQGTVGTTGAATGSSVGTTSRAGTTRSTTQTGAASMPTYSLSGASGNGGGAAAATGTTGAGSYQLQGSALEGHVGQQVEIRGMVLPPERTRAARRSSSAASATTTDAAPQRVRVT